MVLINCWKRLNLRIDSLLAIGITELFLTNIFTILINYNRYSYRLQSYSSVFIVIA
jgi:hypothetical protein